MDCQETEKCVMIITGEASGDLHGAHLVRAIQKKKKALFFCGVGGNALRDAGVQILVDISELTVVGATEVASKLPNLIKGMMIVRRQLKSRLPDLLILIDFPDFNLRVAPAAKKLGIPVLYYISPQVWAWRSGRLKKIRRLVDHMAVILPFEKEYYRKHDIPVTFVGHPLLDNHVPAVHKNSFQQESDPPVIGLLPGSRDKEVSRHLPVMLAASNILSRRMENLKFFISLAPTVKKNYLEDLISAYQKEASCELVSEGAQRIFEKCRFAIVASGTVSLEAAIFGVPMVIVYKVSPLSYWLGRAMISVKYIGLINLIAGKEIAPELIQKQASPENIAKTAYELLKDPVSLERMQGDFFRARAQLGGPGASERTADIAIGML
jgi:lipid-A-disaccharide synthase